MDVKLKYNEVSAVLSGQAYALSVTMIVHVIAEDI
jgi:hypothetical protein